MTQWYPASPALWQGRDDSIEAPDARRLFQTVTRSETFSPKTGSKKIALMGFACDEGVNAMQAVPARQAARTRCVKRWRIWPATRDMNGWWI